MTAPTPNQAQSPEVARPPTYTDWPKEVVAAVIALTIVGMTICFLCYMFFSPTGSDEKTWQRWMTVLQTSMALAGTVTGYYFGRIPAERAAATAMQASSANAARADDANNTKNRVLGQVRALRNQLDPGSSPMGGGGSGSDSAQVQAQIARQLNDILLGE